MILRKLFSPARLGFSLAMGVLVAPALAHADPLTLATAAVAYVGATGIGATVGTFVLTAAIGAVESVALPFSDKQMFGPKADRAK